MRKSKTISNDCECIGGLKQKYLRYSVIKFNNGKFGVVDRNQYHIVHVDGDKIIDRNSTELILEAGQMSRAKAIKLAKERNKKEDAVQFTEIK